MKTCTECRGSARRLRKGRCDACYMRLYRNGEVPVGASCAGCGERRRIVLMVSALVGEETILCGNCVLVADRTRPRLTLDDLRGLAVRWRRLPAAPTLRPDAQLHAAPVAPALDPSID